MTAAIPSDYVCSDSHLVPDLGLNWLSSKSLNPGRACIPPQAPPVCRPISVHQLCFWVDHQPTLLQVTCATLGLTPAVPLSGESGT
ncbi:unnamed protein product [Staurois parvus]|uniref:Uncharacterized protein n=1 Tax=Staurois parvus TaxID=386267 RepID=A0ABN9CUX9_9NEOB|nr:unnamed protein product [Staurois parvus]